MRCLDENVIVDLLQGTLRRDMRGDVEDHLDRCSACRALLADAAKAWREAPERAPARDEQTRADGEALPATRRDAGGDASRPEPTRVEHPPEPVAASRSGVMIDHFRVKALLGRGGMGEVYLARDTQLGRQVAIKVVLPEFLGSDDAIKQFKREARTTARFNHPHIVTIFAVGEFEGKPYVALEYLPGQDLRERLRDRPLSLAEVYRTGLAIAQALAEAHAAGVLHRDLKPENVVIPQDGRLRVVDFGLAKRVPVEDSLAVDAETTLHDDLPPSSLLEERDKSAVVGTPAYMAPEQWLGLVTTSAADIWALGVMLFELCAGQRPFEGPGVAEPALAVVGPQPAPSLKQIAEVPADFARLVAQCLHKNPAERPTARQVVAALGPLLYPDRVTWGGSQSPFRGLLPFTERQAAMFFGREAEIAALCERLRRETVLPVVGPSGAGKSSLVRAGVIPRLREQQPWTIIQLRPSARPLVTLATRVAQEQGGSDMPTRQAVPGGDGSGNGALGSDVEHAGAARIEQLAARLGESPASLSLELRAIAEHSGGHVLLFVDQLEELYTLCDDERERGRFMQAICAAADDASEPVRVVFTLRDDYLGRVAIGPAVQQALSNLAVLQRPGDAELEEILCAPLEALGYQYDDAGLVAEMIDAVRGEAACLPLLQFTAQMLWAHRDKPGRRLLRAEYERLGGVEGALARHADGVLERFSLAEREHARVLLLRLVTPERTRKVVARAAALDGLTADAERVLSRLTEARLVSVRRAGTAPGESQLELVHESLIGGWGTLSRWLDEAREELAFVADLEQAAEAWDRRGQRSQHLWRGDELREAMRSARRCSDEVGDLARAFLRASQSAERRRVRRRRVGVAAAFVALVAALSVAVFVIARVMKAERLARAERARAQLDRATALRAGARAALARRRPLEARAMLRLALETADSTAARALWWQVQDEPLLWRRELGAGGCRVAFSPSGHSVAAGCRDGSVYLFETQTVTQRVLRGHAAAVLGLAYTPDGRRLASGCADGEIRIWDVRAGRLARAIDARSGVQAIAFRGDGRQLASGHADRRVRLWVADTGKLAVELEGHVGAIHDVRFSPDGRLLASCARGDRQVRIWDADTGEQLRAIDGYPTAPVSLSFSPDGALLVGATGEGARLWRMEDGLPTGWLGDQLATGGALSVHPDGSLLALGGTDGTVRLWDAVGEVETGRLAGGGGPMVGLSFSPNGAQLVSASEGGTLCLWDVAAAVGAALDGDRPASPTPLVLGSPPRAWSASGWRWLSREHHAAAAPDERAWPWGPRAWAAVTERARRAVHGTDGRAVDSLCVWTRANELELWDLAADQRVAARALDEIQHIVAHAGGCAALAAGKVQLVQRDALRQLAPGTAATALNLSRGRLLLAAGDHVRVYDETGREVERFPTDVGVSAMALAAPTPSGPLLVGYRDGTVELLPRPATGTEAAPRLLQSTPPGAVVGIVAAPRDTVVVAHAGGFVGLWDQRDGSRLALEQRRSAMVHLLLDDDWLLAVADRGDQLVWDLSALSQPYCELLADVWQGIPVVWQAGRAVAREAPHDHPCSPVR